MSELDYRQVLDALADAVVAADGTGRMTYVNSAAEQLLGWSAHELLGQPLSAIIPSRLHGAHRAGFARYLSTRSPHLIGRPVRVPALRRDGTEVEIELTLAAFCVGEAEDLFVASLRDLRDRVELERQLTVTRYLRAATTAAARLTSHLDLEAVLRTVVETLVDDFDAALARIWLYEAETNTLHLRASAGLSTATATSSRARIDVATYPYKVGVVARTRRPFVKNGLLGDPHFEQAWVQAEKLAAVAAFPLLIAGGLRGVLVFFSRQELRDEVSEVLATFAAMVTAALHDTHLFLQEQAARAEATAHREELEVANEELQVQQEELTAANARLLEADRQKDQFLAMLAHELRNPLAVISNALYLIRTRSAHDPSLAKPGSLLQRQVERMGRLIDDLLDTSRISRGKVDLEVAPLDLTALVRQATEDCASELAAAGLTLTLELPEEPLPITADATRLGQALMNLLGNAIKFTDPGGTVSVQVFKSGTHAVGDGVQGLGTAPPEYLNTRTPEHLSPHVAVIVRDTGIGIEPEMLPHIFEPFAQAAKGVDRNRGGLGLGLTLVRGLVELHGGEVQVASEGPGKGAEFTLFLPLGSSGGGDAFD